MSLNLLIFNSQNIIFLVFNKFQMKVTS